MSSAKRFLLFVFFGLIFLLFFRAARSASKTRLKLVSVVLAQIECLTFVVQG